MKNGLLILILATTYVTTIMAQIDFSNVIITTEQVTDNIYMLQGSGGNIAILTGEDGTLMVDDQFAPLSDKIMAAIKDISDQPVHYLLNTHWHGDHTGGNENFANAGATIIAHDNVRKRLSTDNVRPFGRTTLASPEAAWPQLTFNDEMHIHYNNENIHLIHNHNAHTDGDAFVYFSDSNVLHMGDCFFKDRFPFIDRDMGGSPDGYIKAVSQAILITDSDTKIIPGHGSLASKVDLLNYYNMLITMRDRVKKSISDGQSLEEALEANLTEGYESWGTGFINNEKIVKVLYEAYVE
jgi:cyclase